MTNNEFIPSFYSIITATVRYDIRLNANEKIFYSEISALTNMYGYCFATNKYFARLYNVDVRTIVRWIRKLEKCGYIYCKLIYNEKQQVTERRIYLRGIDIDVMTSDDPNVIHNIIDNNKHTITKQKYFDNVFISKEEYQSLITNYGEEKTKRAIEELSLYKKSKNTQYHDDYATIKRWVITRVNELIEKEKQKKESQLKNKKKNNYSNYQQREYSTEFLEQLYRN